MAALRSGTCSRPVSLLPSRRRPGLCSRQTACDRLLHKRAPGLVRTASIESTGTTAAQGTRDNFNTKTKDATNTITSDRRSSGNGSSAAATTAPTAPTAPATSPAEQTSGSTFPWMAHWYPVAVVDDLDPTRPHATHLLGIPLALWRDKQGAWHAVEDKCPHRLAPLSEGRLESDGTLQCAYHGWQFNGAGTCTHIPQLRGDDKAQQAACASRRACVRAFPTQVVHGLLWVLPDSSPEAHDKFAREHTVPVNAVHQLLGGPGAEGWKQISTWFARDLPVKFDTLVENVVDASHVPFAHHGVQSRREAERGTTTKLVGDMRVDGFEFDYDQNRPGMPAARTTFTAPNHVQYKFSSRALSIYAVPIRPGWSRVYTTFMQDMRSSNKAPWFITALFRLLESVPWLEHLLSRNAVFDGDTYMLHVQERLLEEQKGDWRKGYYMPAAADGSVVAVRKWLDKYGGVVPTCEPGAVLSPAMTKREVLDRYSQHTQHCRHCKKALRNIDIARAVAAAAGVMAAAWLAARLLLGLPLLAPATGAGLAAGVACGAVVAGLRALRQMFFFVDYVHAERN